MTALKGYTFPREFGGFIVPIPMQSGMLRQYAMDHRLEFHLHVVESILPGSYVIFEDLVRSASSWAAIGMCSIFMLPSNSDRRRQLLCQALRAGCSLHFVLEQLVISHEEQIGNLNDELALGNVTARLCSFTQHEGAVDGHLRP